MTYPPLKNMFTIYGNVKDKKAIVNTTLPRSVLHSVGKKVKLFPPFGYQRWGGAAHAFPHLSSSACSSSCFFPGNAFFSPPYADLPFLQHLPPQDWKAEQSRAERSSLIFCAGRSLLRGNMGEEATSSSKDIIDDYREIVDRTDSKQSSVHGRVKERLKHSFSVAEMGKNRTSNLNIVNGSEEMHKRKKVEGTQAYEKTTSYDNKMKEAKAIASEEKIIATPVPYIEIEDFSSEPSCLKKPERNITSQGVQHLQSKPPFFLFGNVSDVSPETWRRLSHFLYGIEPEHVNTQFFSAIIRKEGYYHNLPRGDRFHILPKPPMTIEDALPHTGRWWPAWDTRKQLSCITHDTAGVAHMCDRLEKMLEDSRGILSTQQQLDALHQCKNLNLVWVGHHRLGPIEPDHIERILGYPVQHTKVQGLEPSERFAALKCCFQIDTLGYHLSVLKRMYPSGLRVLSVFSGIGGAEVALHRLGIHLKCVVSVDVPRVNGAILKRWWQNTGQSGELRQIDGIERLTEDALPVLHIQITNIPPHNQIQSTKT
ncbi:hypothetical protein Taro_030396 [Colocasia esculenta]|uniref:SAM-dependent MTase DRM-type domain-containing protein n=1 Tax=Colocasia esculenta TaxID=4460 RepID=A0A843VRT0_COLES|nr:hypothetical protein [Colocasia esculenta]